MALSAADTAALTAALPGLRCLELVACRVVGGWAAWAAGARAAGLELLGCAAGDEGDWEDDMFAGDSSGSGEAR